MISSTRVILLKSALSKAGGLEKYTLRLAKAFQEKNCAVTILTTGESIEEDNLEIISHKLKSKMSFKRLLEFDAFCMQYLKNASPQIVFGMDRNRFQTHIRAGNGVHASYLRRRSETEGFLKKLSFALNPLHLQLLSIEKSSFEDPQLQILFANSKMVQQEILEHYSTDPNKIQVVHNGVEWEEMQPYFSQWQEKKVCIAKDLQLDPFTFHFLFIGHNYQRKGLGQLLQGLSLLPHRDFHLSVVGKDKNSAHFQKLSVQLDLPKQVTFFGNRKDISSFYQLADALVIPSFYDPFANVTVEALSMGVFVISSKYNGGHEVLTSENGRIIERLSDPHSLAEALKQALDHPKTRERSKVIRNSAKHLDFSSQLSKITELCLK